MGTNYYVNERPPCECCKRPFEQLHIGKSSGGWQFLFAPYPDRGLTTAAAWLAYLQDKEIVDEYDRPVALDELRELIESKQGCWTGFTAPPEAYGGHNPAEYEYLDPEGHRFATRPGFS